MEQKASTWQKILIPGVIIIVGVVVSAVIICVSGTQNNDDGVQNLVPRVSVADHVQGPSDAKITIIEYSDFRCPYCGKLYPTVERIVNEGGDIRVVYRHLPLTGKVVAGGPAMASECIARLAHEDAFWRFADTLFKNQSKIDREYLETLALADGITEKDWNTCLASQPLLEKVSRHLIHARFAGARGTPFVVVVNERNGEMFPFSGALPYDSIMDIIKKARES